MYANKNKVMGCLMGGAIGDAFGAPVEAIFKLSELKKRYGQYGIQEFQYYKSPWDDSEREGMGVITDDTTMSACTLAAIVETAGKKNFQAASLDKTYAYYMLWGQQQKFGDVIKKSATIKAKAPDYLKPFLFRCGAGLNTLGALSAGYRGTLEKPVEYDVKIDGKDIKNPNKGCGGLMRIAPVAFLYDDIDIIAYSMQNAAITHGDPDAIAATAAVAVLTANALKHKTLKEALAATKKDFQKIPNNKGILESWSLAEKAFQENEADMITINGLCKKQGKNTFLALPVLTQSLFAVHVASSIKKPCAEDFKNMMRLSANHVGDSDSVAAIVGSVIGASWGYDCLPKDWMDVVQQKDDIIILGCTYLKTARQQRLAA